MTVSVSVQASDGTPNSFSLPDPTVSGGGGTQGPTPTFGLTGGYLTSGNSTAASVPVPAGVAVNDIILVPFFWCPLPANPISGGIAAPPGFQLGSHSDIPVDFATKKHSLTIFWKRQGTATGAGETTGTYPFVTPAGIDTRCGVAVRITGCVVSGSPFDFDVSNTADVGTVPTTTPPVSGNTADINRLLVWAASSYHSATVIAMPTGFVQRAKLATDGQFILGLKPQTAAGPTGDITAAFTGTASSKGVWLAALKPVVT